MDKTPVPIIVADTSALQDMMSIEAVSDQLPLKKGGTQFSLEEMIDALCIDGGRTMIMPGVVITELFPTLTGRLTLSEDAQGHPQFPIGFGQENFPLASKLPFERHQLSKKFPFERQNTLYQYFSKLAQQGKLRCYDTPEAMLAAGEVSEPKGGIVFVSMGERREKNGHAYSERKAKRQLAAPDSEEPVGINHHKDEGDKDVCRLLEIIDAHSRCSGKFPRILLLNTDGGLYSKLNVNNAGIIADFTKPAPLVESMVNLGMINNQMRPAFAHAMVELAKEDSFWSNAIERLTSPVGKRYMKHDVYRTSRWLEATQNDNEPEDRTR